VVWYRRAVEIPAEFLAERLLLHVGACDYEARVWVNGAEVGWHRGGYAGFACEIQSAAHPGVNEIVIRAEDRPHWSQPRGKQIVGDQPVLIDYDRVTGIWQTVWLEPVRDVYVTEAWSRFDLGSGRLVVEAEASTASDGELEVVLSFAGGEVARGRAWFQGGREARVNLDVAAPRLWSPADPALHDLRLRLVERDGVLDEVDSYAGLRQWTRHGRELRLNGEPFYLRGLLDQGYFPGGWYTAPTDADLERDIRLMQAAGFNGARKHQKVEDPRWLWWADRLGFVVWGEMPSGRQFGSALVADLTREWIEIVRRDRMHPCVMAWVPLNESWGVDAVDRSPRQREWVRALEHLTRALDPDRWVVANDGWQFFCGDLWGVHCYESGGEALGARLRQVLDHPATEVTPARVAALPDAATAGVPILLTELGGVSYRDPARPAAGDEWGYRVARDAPDLARRLRELAGAVREAPEFAGFVWTQFTDVQQENNGLFYFDRTPKLPLEELRQIFG
jgi:beta-galactosidase/beta-glucuronidase